MHDRFYNVDLNDLKNETNGSLPHRLVLLFQFSILFYLTLIYATDGNSVIF